MPPRKSTSKSPASTAKTASTKRASASASKAARTSTGSTRSQSSSKSAPRYKDDDEDDLDEDEDDESQPDADDSADDFQAGNEHDDDDEEDDASEQSSDEDEDEDEDDYTNSRSKSKGRGSSSAKRGGRASTSSTASKRKSNGSTPNSKTKKAKPNDSDDDFDDEDDEDDPKRTRRSLGLVKATIGAPTTGHVPPTQVSPHLYNLLKDLQDPAKNDRDWFKERDKLWRYCEKTWLDFVQTLTEKIMDKGDDTIPYLPAKDITYRIYRDVRFSHSKVPYKTEMQATFTRTGRKGNWAGYHLSVNPGRSFIAGGKWHPDKEELGRIRQHILDDTPLGKELKQVVKNKEFIKFFGAPYRSVDEIEHGTRRSLWGAEDQLKISPKIPGLAPSHPSMHFLRLKSFTVYHAFASSPSPASSKHDTSKKDKKDEDAKTVLSPDFQERVCDVVRAMRPLVSVMNRMVHGEDVDGPFEPGSGGGGGGDGEEEDEDEDDDEDE